MRHKSGGLAFLRGYTEKQTKWQKWEAAKSWRLYLCAEVLVAFRANKPRREACPLFTAQRLWEDVFFAARVDRSTTEDATHGRLTRALNAWPAASRWDGPMARSARFEHIVSCALRSRAIL